MRNIYKNFLTFSLALLATLSLYSETVSQKQAKLLAQEFFNEAHRGVTPPVKFVYNGKNLTMDRLFTPFYVYNSGTSGFVIISAENKTFPLLGYSLESSFNPANLSDAQKALLSSYARDIEYVRFETDEPTQAIEAWRDFPAFVRQQLSATPYFGASTLNSEEINLNLSDAVNAIYETSSDLFSPGQWIDIVDSELNANGEVVMGFPYKNQLEATAVTGRRGDYYRFYFNGDQSWMMRILPTEILSGMQVAVIGNPPEVTEPEIPEELPFAFLDSFENEIKNNRLAEEEMYERRLIPVEPQITGMTGGRFLISAPYEVDMVRVYNLSGANVKTFYFKETDVANIDISEQPNGFYVATVYANNQTPYSFKIYR
ncbi:MAG: T9SS type A sorting domain-containing protein [Bacteroidales bacterium]|nr:T9SS type A sorting domain-containing protein [Bacteroidales bacterium]